MTSASLTTPHFAGLWIAIAGAVLLSWWTRRQPRRNVTLLALGLPCLTAIALFGNGFVGVQASQSLPTTLTPPQRAERPVQPAGPGLPPPTSEEVWLAYNTAISPEFLEYIGTVIPELRGISHVRLRSALTARRHGKNNSRGEWIVEYLDYDNWGVDLFDPRLERSRRQRRAFFERLNEFVAELLLVERYRSSASEGDRLLALSAMRKKPRIVAEWLARDTYYFTLASPSRELLQNILLTQRFLRQGIDDPTLRGLAPNTRAVLPVPTNADGSPGSPELERLWTRRSE